MNNITKTPVPLKTQPSKPRPINSEMDEFRRLPSLPLTLPEDEAGWLLGYSKVQIRELVKLGLLEPLGGAGPGDSKRFFTQTLQKLGDDDGWQDTATDAMYSLRRTRTHNPLEA